MRSLSPACIHPSILHDRCASKEAIAPSHLPPFIFYLYPLHFYLPPLPCQEGGWCSRNFLRGISSQLNHLSDVSMPVCSRRKWLICATCTYAILVFLYTHYSNISHIFRWHIVSQDFSRQTAQLLGQQISTLLPETPESVAAALGFGPINKTACHARGQFGKGDGAKNVCLDRLFTDGTVHSRKPCVVLSFGIDFDFSFDLSMSKLGCTVHSFDPVMLTRITLKKVPQTPHLKKKIPS